MYDEARIHMISPERSHEHYCIRSFYYGPEPDGCYMIRPEHVAEMRKHGFITEDQLAPTSHVHYGEVTPGSEVVEDVYTYNP